MSHSFPDSSTEGPVRHSCPRCGADVEFAPMATRHQRACAQCPACGSDLVLYGGQITVMKPVTDPRPG